MNKTALEKKPSLSILIVALVAAGAIHAWLVATGMQTPWYQGLQRPNVTVSWETFWQMNVILYTLMSTGFVMAMQKQPSREVLWSFELQMALIIISAFVFYGLHNVELGLILQAVWLLTLLGTIYIFWKASPLAGILVLPLLAWGCWGLVFQIQILQLNPLI